MKNLFLVGRIDSSIQALTKFEDFVSKVNEIVKSQISDYSIKRVCSKLLRKVYSNESNSNESVK